METEQNRQFEQAIAEFSPEIQQLSKDIRAMLYEVFPEVKEVVWVQQKNAGYGTGFKKKTEQFCWLMPASRHVNLGFNYGTELPDPAGLLEGTGKLYRHVKIRSSGQLSQPALLELIRFATTWKVPPVSTPSHSFKP
jgi:hypothetical protein